MIVDRYEAIKDRIDHIDTLREYYSKAKAPQRKNYAGTNPNKRKLDGVAEFKKYISDNSKYQKEPVRMKMLLWKSLLMKKMRTTNYEEIQELGLST